jgi:hypothetical protein
MASDMSEAIVVDIGLQYNLNRTITLLTFFDTSYLNLKRTRIIRQKALQITSDNGVFLDSGETIPFDYLFLACGSSYNMPFKESNVVLASRGSTLSASYKQLAASNRFVTIVPV